MAKRYPAEQRERATRMALDRLGEYRSAWATAQALGPELGVGAETLRKWIVQAQVDAGDRRGRHERGTGGDLQAQGRGPRASGGPRNRESGLGFLREGARPSPPLICGFLDTQRAAGHGVESICQLLRQQGLAVASRTYRAWKSRPPAARSITDAQLIDRLPTVRTGGPGGRPAPEILYGRRKMTDWRNRQLRAEGHRPVSQHTVERLMRELGMNGLVRGRTVRTTVPAGTGAHSGRSFSRSSVLTYSAVARCPGQSSQTDLGHPRFVATARPLGIDHLARHAP
jgi:transposase-like protein